MGACVGSDPPIAAGPPAAVSDGGAPANEDAAAAKTGNDANASSTNDGGGETTTTPSFTLQADAAKVTVLEGGSMTVKVLLTRTQFKEAVSVTASGFGSGVTISPLEIGAGGTEGTLTITAAVGATHGTATIAIKGVGDGVADATANFDLLVRGAAGALDNSFGTAGKLTGTGPAIGLAVQADGKVVVVGSAGNETFVDRYSADGKPDLGFGASGRATLSDLHSAADVVVRADGKIFVSGDAPSGGTDRFGVTCLGSDGKVVDGYGTHGTRAFLWPDSFGTIVTSIGLDASGNVLVGGHVFTNGSWDFALLRFTGDDGHLDPSFSGDGFDNIDFNAGSLDFAYAMAVKPDGTVVMAGGAEAPNAFAIARWLPGGNPDPGLNTTGHATHAFSSTKISSALAVAIQPDNKIVTAGYFTPNSGTDESVLVRFDAAGTPDSHFGNNGNAIMPVNSRYQAVAVQPDGAILVAGYFQPSGASSQFLVARYTGAGVLDTTFASTGVVKMTFAGEGDVATRLVRQPDGRILVGGKAGTSNYGIARYWD